MGMRRAWSIGQAIWVCIRLSGLGDPVKLPGLYGSVKSLQGRRLSARS